MPTNDIRPLHRRVILDSVAIADRVRPAELDRPTPCTGWTVADLLAHMIAQHHGFAAAAQGHGGDLGAWQVRPLGPDPAAEYRQAADRVLAAFGADGVLDSEVELAEFAPASRFPAAMAIRFHLIDYVVHGWDLARALGLPYRLAPEVAEVAVPIATSVPDGEERRKPGAAFAPGLPLDTTGPLDRILAALGRSPSWAATP